MPCISEQQSKMRALSAERGLRTLFIGNSATYVHDIPQALSCLSIEAGYPLEAIAVVKGGYELSQHANADTPHGRRVLDEIAKGYDVIILQDNGSCVTSEEKSEATRFACSALHRACMAAGSDTYIYVRPPYGHDHAGRTPLEQCVAFDRLFDQIGDGMGAVCVGVNRAFAYAMTHTDLELWGPDHAHTSERGAYLAVCVFFATLFGISATKLGTNELPPSDALILQRIADMIALEGILPWDTE